MIERSHFPFKYHMLLYPIAMVLIIWIAYWTEVQWDANFARWGILPRTVKGLRGILFSPFIHGDGLHLLHNSLPLLVLSTALFYFYDSISFKILLYGTLLTGIFTWSIGRESYHIGASGVIYMLFGFLSLKGMISKHFRLLSLSFFVIFTYGSLVWYVAPIEHKISWEGHLSGLVTGILFAFVFKKDIVARPKYKWENPTYIPEENDEFMKCFDENGNFIPTSERLALEQELENTKSDYQTTSTYNQNHTIRLIYHHIPTKKTNK